MGRFLARVRTWELRQKNSMFRRSRPANIDRARRVGYKNKQGYVVFSCKVRGGGSSARTQKESSTANPPTTELTNSSSTGRISPLPRNALEDDVPTFVS